MQFSHWYGGVQLTTRQWTPPLHEICVLHWPYRKALQQIRRWSQVAFDPVPHEQLQHRLSQIPSLHPVEHLEQVALQSTM